MGKKTLAHSEVYSNSSDSTASMMSYIVSNKSQNLGSKIGTQSGVGALVTCLMCTYFLSCSFFYADYLGFFMIVVFLWNQLDRFCPSSSSETKDYKHAEQNKLYNKYYAVV